MKSKETLKKLERSLIDVRPAYVPFTEMDAEEIRKDIRDLKREIQHCEEALAVYWTVTPDRKFEELEWGF